MQFDKGFDIWECAAADDTRPVLATVLIERVRDGESTGRMVAADGYMLAVAPCMLDDSDVPGLVSVASLKAAAKLAKGSTPPQLLLDDTSALLVDGTLMPRPDQTLRFPDYGRITPNIAGQSAISTGRLHSFNPHLLVKLCKALGWQASGRGPTGNVSLIFSADGQGPILVETQAPNEQGQPVAPYGVLMPMYSKYPVRTFNRAESAVA